MILMTLAISPARAQHNPFRAPLYWSVYENQFVKESNHDPDVHITEDEWRANIDWVDQNLKDHGYTMICIDGWGDVTQINSNGYRRSHSRHWTHDYAWWSGHLQGRGMTLGMYGNPLWVHVADDDTHTLIAGTNIPVATLKNPGEQAKFPWVQVDRPGAEAYVKGYIRFYADMGIRYLRVDFLSWYEDGTDRWIGRTGPQRPRAHYETALRWMREAADETGMFLSLVMPHLYHEAAAEQRYGHMIRINEDTGQGGWSRWSDFHRGARRTGWSVYANPADGLTYWSRLAGRHCVILDPDFIRLNTFTGDDEKRSVISLCLLAGAPVTVADQHDTIGTDLWLYSNRELLELNRDGFVGQPLTHDPTQAESQVWTGQLSNGDWIVGLFNREDTALERGIDFSALGIPGQAAVRDLWAHENLGKMKSFRAVIPPRGCRVLRVVPPDAAHALPEGPTAMFVQSITQDQAGVAAQEKRGVARIVIMDNKGGPVAGAVVRARFSGSFDEEVSGVTDATGTAVLQTAGTAAGATRSRVCVLNVLHPALSYAGSMNTQTCAGSQMYVAGTFSGWQSRAMTFVGDRWVLRSQPLDPGDHEIKFLDTPDFSGMDWGAHTGRDGIAEVTTGGKANIRFNILQPGCYEISFSDVSRAYQVRPLDSL